MYRWGNVAELMSKDDQPSWLDKLAEDMLKPNESIEIEEGVKRRRTSRYELLSDSGIYQASLVRKREDYDGGQGSKAKVRRLDR